MDYLEDFSDSLRAYVRYMNTASLGLPPNASREATFKALELAVTDPLKSYDETWAEVERIRELFSGLYGFIKNNIGVGESTSHCIYKMAAALEPVKIGVSSEEFPGVVMMLKSYCARTGCRVVEYDGLVEDALKTAIDDGADMVLASAVTWVTGYRASLSEIIRYARKRGVRVIVDAVQHFGSLMLRSGELDADGYAASVKKWLLAPHSNTAVCVVGKSLLDKNPPYYGLGNSNVKDWSAYWSDPAKRGVDELPLREDGHRFSAPTGLHYPSIVAARASLEYLHGIGVRRVEEYISRLRDVLVEGLEELGLTVYAGVYGEANRSGIVSFDAGGYGVNRRVYNELVRRGYMVSLRGQRGITVIRVSLHIYNTDDDAVSFIDTLKYIINR